MHTKKVGTTGRFGNKYGRKIRQSVAKIEASSRAKHVCPICLRQRLVRESAGIWRCNKCSSTIAGGAYNPITVATKIMKGEVAAFAEAPDTASAAPEAQKDGQKSKAQEKPASKKPKEEASE